MSRVEDDIMGKKVKTLFIIVGVVIVLGVLGFVGYVEYFEIKGNEYFKRGDYSNAYECYKQVKFGKSVQKAKQIEIYNEVLEECKNGEYKDAIADAYELTVFADKQNVISYLSAFEMISEGNYEVAARKFEVLGDYLDSEYYAENLPTYKKGITALENEDYETAKKIFGNLLDFLDSRQRLEAIYDYYDSLELMADGDYEAAMDIMEQADDVLDNVQEIDSLAVYNEAMGLLNSNKVEMALSRFSSIKDFEGSAEMIEKINAYISGTTKHTEGNYMEAIKDLEKAGGIADCEYYLKDSYYEYGYQLLGEGKPNDAAWYFREVYTDKAFVEKRFPTQNIHIDEDTTDDEGYGYVAGEWLEKSVAYYDSAATKREEVFFTYRCRDDVEPEYITIGYETPDKTRAGRVTYAYDGSYLAGESYSWDND